ncbi:MAG: TonB-dependent receptor [Acidobacteria bacterium]|nr:TonB-dependent receptor [Acidobacteriota bacterium]
MRRIWIGALLVIFGALAGTASAQTLTGTVTGTVVDEQGAVLPGVTVTLTGRTGAQTQVADAHGEYRFVGVTPGEYTLRAELEGFRIKQEQTFPLSIGQTAEFRLTMVVGGLTESVDVVAQSVMIDTASAKTDTNMSQSLLFSMPISHNNPGPNIVNYSPGINSGSAFGGASDGANALMLDGVDTRDPEGGTSWAFYNYNIIDEIQVGSLGQPAEYGGFTGAIVNTITKSGGNRFAALAEYRYSSDNFSSSNVTDDLLAKNATLGTPVKILKYKDYTVQLGGPIKKDKIFFFASTQRYEISQYRPPVRTEVSPRFNIKFTNQLTSTDNLVAALQYDQYNQTGRTGLIPGYAVSNHDQTIDQDSPEYVWNLSYRKVFGGTSFLEAKYIGWWGYYDLNPVSPGPTHFDGETSAYSGGAGYTGLYDRTRNQANVSFSTYAEAAGRHNFKFGIEFERSTIRDRFVYSGATTAAPTGVFYYDYGGPYIAYGYSYDLKGTNKRESFYAQDQWKVGRLTANIGLRFDNIRGEASTLGEDLYDTKSWGPRLGAAYDLTGSGKSVARAFWGQLYEGAVFASWSRAVPGMTPFRIYEVGPNWSSLSLIDESDRQYSVGDDLKHPRVDEFNASFEQLIGNQFKVTVTGIARDWKNFINSVLDDGIWTPFTYTPTPATQAGVKAIGAPVTLYRWANPTSVPRFTIRNTDQVSYRLSDGSTLVAPEAYRKYRGLMIVLQKALTHRWQAQLSYVLSKTTGTINNSTYAGFSSGQFETPNGIVVNSGGRTAFDRRHEVKLFASYQIPKAEVLLSGYVRYLSGAPYTAVSRLSGGRFFNWPSSLTINIEPLASNMNDSNTNVDLRLEKVFDFGIHRFGIYADLENAFNTAVVTARVTRYPSETLTNPQTGDSVRVWFGDPRNLNQGRQVTLAARWSF